MGLGFLFPRILNIVVVLRSTLVQLCYGVFSEHRYDRGFIIHRFGASECARNVQMHMPITTLR
ncbi:hypothetical protein M758_UG149100 [Ceratodon purpureus]|nr:hypothetical protein M758_UG149100 [Ceratodon purpureus]